MANVTIHIQLQAKAVVCRDFIFIEDGEGGSIHFGDRGYKAADYAQDLALSLLKAAAELRAKLDATPKVDYQVVEPTPEPAPDLAFLQDGSVVTR